MRSDFSTIGWRLWPLAFLLASAQADTLEEKVARGFVRDFERNEARLREIETELASLPTPYMREPTGTGGYLSHGRDRADDEIFVRFTFEKPRKLDAVALFPLRLFMDEIYSDNLYWPDHITVEAWDGDKGRVLATRDHSQQTIRQSLPELIEFEPVTTECLLIRCTGLGQHPHEKWFAAGFSEICVFSGKDNVAPRAEVFAKASRQGYHVLAKEFLTDGQTPLGIPELSGGEIANSFLKRMMGKKPLEKPYVLTLTYSRDISIDAIRIDPAIEHSYGQAFPVRFTIKLLDELGREVHTDNTYTDFPLRPPGLNPFFAYWPDLRVRSVRLEVMEISRPLPEAPGSIALSEITPLFRGKAAPRPVLIEESHDRIRLKVEPASRPTGSDKRALVSTSDGLTHAGTQLPLREWIRGLARRQELLEEQLALRTMRETTLTRVSRTLVYGSLSLLLLVAGGAAYAVVRNRIRLRKELRTTRARIASDLHDDVGSNLGTIILHVDDLKEHTDNPRQQSRLEAIHRLTSESVFGLREVLATTTPEVGRTQNIVAYMEELAGLILGKTEHTFHTAPAMSESLLDYKLRKGILLFYKEALYNAKRHAECTHIDISLRRRGKRILLTVSDNGKGIDAATRARPRNLRTLKKRAEHLQADLDIQTEPGAGTKLTLSIPTDTNP